MKKVILIILTFFLAFASHGQQQSLEDFKTTYNPDPHDFLVDFIPPGAVLLTDAQAQVLSDEIDLSNDGKVSWIRITADNMATFFQKDNMLISMFVVSDSLKWQIAKDIHPVEQQSPSVVDPYAPIQVVEEEQYESSYDIHNIEDLELFCYYSAHANYSFVKPYYVSRSIVKPTIESVVYYCTDAQFASIFAYDKNYVYRIKVSVEFKESDRQAAINTINWIADHMTVQENLPLH